MIQKKKNAAGGNLAAEVNLHSDFVTKIINRQAQSRYAIEISFRRNEDANLEFYDLGVSDEARSMLLIARCERGITRAEALDKFFILSLTQHVHKIRKQCGFWDVIETERVKPKRHARYHLPSNISVRVFKCGGQ